MIKFFRHIRKSLIEKNQMGKYFKYAIGEILLVVIGILIALQINNWNENKKLKVQEKEALNEILSDLNVNIDNLNLTLKGKERRGNIKNTINSLKIVITHLKSKKAYNDSLDNHFGIMYYSLNNINYKTSGYESLSSIGLDLIKNTKLRSEIGEYYTSSIKIPQNVSLGLNNDFENYMLEYIRKKFITKDSANTYTLHPKNYSMLRDKGEYLESLKLYLSVYQTYEYEIKNAIKSSQFLKNRIKTYLDN